MVATRDRRMFLGAITAGGLAAALPDPRVAAADVPWLNEVQQAPDAIPDDVPRLRPLLGPNSSLDDWRSRRLEFRRWWRDYLGPFDVRQTRSPRITVLESDRVGNVLRKRIRYEVEPWQWTEAYWLAPADRATSPRPGVVVFHSTVDHSIYQPAGLAGPPEKWFGLRLAERGMVTLCPRNYLWPTNDKIMAQREADRFQLRNPECKGMARMLSDGQIALDVLSGLPGVDPGRLGALGHSLGAKEVLYLAAFDERVKVSVSSEGGIGTTYSNWDAPWYLDSPIRGDDFDHEHHELLALVAPRAFLLVGGDSADGRRSWPFVAAAMEVYRRFDGRPRIGLDNHGQGHSVPIETERRIIEWMETYL